MDKQAMYTDTELVRKIKSEKERKQAILHLYQQSKDQILRLVLKYGGKEGDHTELMHDCFLILIQNVQKDRFQFQAKLSTYYIGICRRTWLNRLGKQSKFEELTELPELAMDTITEIAQQERLKALTACLEQLGDRGKQLLLLSRESPRIPWPEIAERLDYSSHQTAKNAAQRFLKRVSDCVHHKLAA